MLRSAVALAFMAAVVSGGCGKRGPTPAEVEAAKRDQHAVKLQTARTALDCKRFGEARAALGEASQLVPLDPVAVELLERVDKAQKEADYAVALSVARAAMDAKDYQRALDEAAKALRSIPDDKIASELRGEADFALRMQRGQSLMAADEFEKAVSVYTRALELRPMDPVAKEHLQQAQEARKLQVQRLFDEAMATGREEMKAKNYQLALAAFGKARTLKVDNEDCQRLADEAEFLLNRESGRQALSEKKFAAAIAFFEKAQAKRRDDEETTGLLTRARAEKLIQDKADYERHMAAGRAAFADSRFVAAKACFDDADKALRVDGEAKRLATIAEFWCHLDAGRKRLEAKKPTDAIASLKKAEELHPLDDEFKMLLTQAQAEELEQKKTAYAKHLNAGTLKLSQRNYADAILEFEAAQKLLPHEAEVGNLLSKAQGQKRDYDGHLSRGKSALSAHRYQDALSELEKAKAMMPPGGEAERLWSDAKRDKSSYETYMSTGRSALAGNRYDDAIRAFRQAERLGPSGGSEAMGLRVEAERKKRQKAMDLISEAERKKAQKRR